LWNYYCGLLRNPKKNDTPIITPEIAMEIVAKFKEAGIRVMDYKVDKKAYYSYLQRAKYHQYSNYIGAGKTNLTIQKLIEYSPAFIKSFFRIFAGSPYVFIEKTLEHFICADLLKLTKDDVYIDIAASNSPVADIYNSIFSSKSYKQDLLFPKGIKGNIIGGDAANMPIADGFATAMGLHCSFEHFEGNADKRFIKEASRVLTKGGKMCILPLYMFNIYAIRTDPTIIPKGGIKFEKDATLYCSKGYVNRHGRQYDVPHFISRIVDNLDGLDLTIHVVQNEKEINQNCYVKFIALFVKK
jgi:SAM-dependent methyltransferase